MPDLAVSPKEFAKHPIAYVLYFCILAIGALYTEGKITAKNREKYLIEQTNKCETKNYLQDVKIEYLIAGKAKSDSLLNRIMGKIEASEEYKKPSTP